MKVRKIGSIPTEEELLHAKERTEHLYRGVSQAREQVLTSFVTVMPLHDVHIFVTDETSFHVVIFLKKDSDIDVAVSDGSISAICSTVARTLEQHGRGPRGALSIVPEVDSDENVHRKFNGNYFYRLR